MWNHRRCHGNDLPCKYERNHSSATPWIPNCLSSRRLGASAGHGQQCQKPPLSQVGTELSVTCPLSAASNIIIVHFRHSSLCAVKTIFCSVADVSVAQVCCRATTIHERTTCWEPTTIRVCRLSLTLRNTLTMTLFQTLKFLAASKSNVHDIVFWLGVCWRSRPSVWCWQSVSCVDSWYNRLQSDGRRWRRRRQHNVFCGVLLRNYTVR